MRWYTKILVVLGITGTLGASVPIIPQNMYLVASYQGPYDAQFQVAQYCEYASSTSPCTLVEKQIELGRDPFPDDDGNGLVSWSKFMDRNGNEVLVQIPDEQYARMGQKTGTHDGKTYGFTANPKAKEYMTLGESLTQHALAAISFDNASGTRDNSGAVTSMTYSHTVTGSDLVIVGVQSILPSDGGGQTMTSMTYNGDALTEVDEQTVSDGSTRARMAIYVRTNPDTGTNNMVTAISATVDGTQQYAAHSMTYTGAAQSGQPDSNGFNSASNDATDPYTVSTTVVAENSWLVGAFVGNQGDFPAGVGGTGTVQRQDDQFNQVAVDSDGTVGTGSQTLEWDRSNPPSSASEHVAMVVSIAPLVAAAAVDSTTFEILP